MPRRIIRTLIEGRSLISASPQMTVRAACRQMTEYQVGALLVVENNRIAGIFTERDALNKILSTGVDPDKTSLADVMVRNPQTITADKPLAHAMYMMSEGGFRHVPVVDSDGTPLGMVSARDALGQDMLDLERELKHLHALEASIGY